MSYDDFVAYRAQHGKKSSKKKYKVYRTKCAAISSSSEGSEDEEPSPKRKKTIDICKKQPRSKKHAGAVTMFQNALIAAGEGSNGATQLSKAQAAEAKNAVNHRRRAFSKSHLSCHALSNYLIVFWRWLATCTITTVLTLLHKKPWLSASVLKVEAKNRGSQLISRLLVWWVPDELVLAGTLDPFMPLADQKKAAGSFEMKLRARMPLSSTLHGTKSQHGGKLAEIMANIRKRCRWSKWKKVPRGDETVWVSQIPGHPYTVAALEIVSTNKTPSITEITCAATAAGIPLVSCPPPDGKSTQLN